MQQPLLFIFGFAIFGFVLSGCIAYQRAKRREIDKVNLHYANWGN